MQNKLTNYEFINNLEAMCRLCSVSGHEQPLLDFIVSKLPSSCNHKFDNLNNLVVKKNSNNKNSCRKVMLVSPIDEVGLLINCIEADGTLKFLNIGRINPGALIGSVVEINNFCAVIGSTPPHLQRDREKNNTPSIESMFIDLGVCGKEQAEKKVQLGDVASFKSNFLKFGENRVNSKSINSKIGCSLMLNLLQNFDECEFFCAFLTKNNVCSSGASTITNLAKPDIAIILDSFEEQFKNKKSSFKLTLNPATSKTIFNLATEIAKLNKLKFEVEVSNKLGNVEQQIMQAGGGVSVLNLSIPCKLINSLCSNFSLSHALYTLTFLKKLIPILVES